MSLNYETLGIYANTSLQEFISAYQNGNNIAALYYDVMHEQAGNTPSLVNVEAYADQARRVTLGQGVRGNLPNFFSFSAAEALGVEFSVGSEKWLTAQHRLMQQDYSVRQQTTTGELDYQQIINIHDTAFREVNLPVQTFTIATPLTIIAKHDPAQAQALFLESLTDERFFDTFITDGINILWTTARELVEAAIANGNGDPADLVKLAAWAGQATAATGAAYLTANLELVDGIIQSVVNGVTFDTIVERSVIVDNYVYYLQQFSNRLDVDDLSNRTLISIAQGDYIGANPEQSQNARLRAVAELAIRWQDDPQALLADNIAWTSASNGGAVSAILVSGLDHVGSITTVTRGNFKVQAIETIGGENAPDIVQVITEDLHAGTGGRSEVMTIAYPENFNFQYAGGYFGGLLADAVADDSLFQRIVLKTLFTTAGQTAGTFADLITIPANSLHAAAYAATSGVDTGIRLDLPELSDRLAGNLAATVANILGQRIVDELTEAVHLGGVAGEVLDVALGTVTIGALDEVLNFTFRGLDGGVYANLLDSGFDFDRVLPGSGITIGEAIQAQVFASLGGYVGTRLAGEVVTPESQQAAIFGSIGSTLGISITTNVGILANLAISKAVSAAFATFGSFAPIIGTAIGAFVGQIVGTVIGNLFSSEDEPISWAGVRFDGDTHTYVLTSAWGDDGGNPEIAENMANALISGVNDIIELTGGDLRRSANAPIVELGLDGDRFGVIIDGTPARFFDNSGEAIQHAALGLLKGFDLVGGHAVLMRAWHNSEATTLQEFNEDIEVAEAFQAYLANPTGILAVMMNEPESPAAMAWAKVLERAGELQLHVPHARDLDGGWGELLAARGDIDPSLIPNIDGATLTLTDPVTGAVTRVEHVIGPGYEIIRIPGTDGNDIIDVIIDGSSITHVDAMAGDDIINGSEERDIILGGEGNDTINGNGGDDWINGGAGNDTVNGNGGQDLLYGSDGDDMLTGAENDDDIYGGAGNDTLIGRGGRDRLYGGAGDDVLISEEENPADDLFGEDGDDTLIVHSYGSLVSGGRGNDTIELNNQYGFVNFSRGDGHDTITFSPTGQQNLIRFDRTIGANDLWFQRVGDDLRILVLNEAQSVTIDDYFIKSHNFEINAGDAYLEPVATILQVHQHHAAYSAQPSGPSNTIAESVLLQGPANGFWQINTGSVGNPPAGPYLYTEEATLSAGQFATGSTAYHFRYGGDVFTDLSIHDRVIFAGHDADTITLAGGTATVHGGLGADVIVANAVYANASGNDRTYLYGDAGNDQITGSIGKDLIHGGIGDDILLGDAASDTIHGGLGGDTLYGGAGADLLFGDAGDDFLNGDAGNDELSGGGGHDTLQDLSGNNMLSGDAGNDTVTAGAGHDVLSGGEGDDWLHGGAGMDRLDGGPGSDTLSGGDDDDVLSGGEARDFLDGNKGNDIVLGGGGDDRLIYVMSHNIGATDRYDGGEGADALRLRLTTAQLNQPHMIGDLLRFRFHVTEQLAATPTGATISYLFALMALSAIGIETLELELTDNATTPEIAYDEHIGTITADTLTAGSAHAYLEAGAGDDTLTGGSGDDVLLGGAGDDVIATGGGWNLARGDDGDDHLSGADGDDGLTGGLGADNLDGGAGDDTLHGQAGNDVLVGGSGADTLDGGSGDDILHGGTGADTLTGGLDRDTFRWAVGDLDGTLDTVTDFRIDQSDRISLQALLTFGRTVGEQIGTFVRLVADGLDARLEIDANGAAGGQSFSALALIKSGSTLPAVADLLATGRLITVPPNSGPLAQQDVISVLRGDPVTGNVLSNNGNGADSDPDGDPLTVDTATLLTAAGGAVTISANGILVYIAEAGFVGTDNVSYTVRDPFGGIATATATLTFGARSGDIVGTTSADTLYGTTADNVLTGLAGNDLIKGRDGNDVIYGGLGDDDLRGEAGNDHLLGGTGDDYLDGDDGNDVLSGGNGADDLRGDLGNDTLDGDADDDFLQGNEGDDVLRGGAGNDTLYADTNNTDTIQGHDDLDGGEGDDLLYGGLGNDTYRASPGQDYIYDRGGTDRLYLNRALVTADLVFATDPTDSNDMFLTFAEGLDRIHIENQLGASADHKIETLAFVDEGRLSIDRYAAWIYGTSGNETINATTAHDTVLAGAGNDIVYGKAGDDELIGEAGGDTLRGEDGNDVLHGGSGDDYLFGGAGDDTLIAGVGQDRLEGNGGADRFVLHGADAYQGLNRIVDFNHADGDRLVLVDLLQGFDPITDLIAEFITLTQSATNTYVVIDRDGAGTEHSAQQVARFEGLTGQWSTAQEMIDEGDLVVA